MPPRIARAPDIAGAGVDKAAARSDTAHACLPGATATSPFLTWLGAFRDGTSSAADTGAAATGAAAASGVARTSTVAKRNAAASGVATGVDATDALLRLQQRQPSQHLGVASASGRRRRRGGVSHSANGGVCDCNRAKGGGRDNERGGRSEGSGGDGAKCAARDSDCRSGSVRRRSTGNDTARGGGIDCSSGDRRNSSRGDSGKTGSDGGRAVGRGSSGDKDGGSRNNAGHQRPRRKQSKLQR